MKPEINYRFLREDEAEAEYSRLHKTLNLFNVMVQRKLSDGTTEEDLALDREIGRELKYVNALSGNFGLDSKNADDRKSRSTRHEKGLKLTDLEELDSGSDADDDDDDDVEDSESNSRLADPGKLGEDGQKQKGSFNDLDSRNKFGSKLNGSKDAMRMRLLKKKQRAAAIIARMRRGVKKKQKRKNRSGIIGSSEEEDPDEEAQDDSEVDDHEGDEVDYMTNSSSDEEKLSDEEREKIYEETGVDEEVALKALLTDLSSEEEEKSEHEPDDLQTENDSGDEESGRKNRTLGIDDSTSLKPNDGLDGTSNDKIHRNRNKRTNKEGADSDIPSSSSSSSSSVDGDSSTYSSSDSDLDQPNDRSKITSKSATKKAEVFKKLADSIHGSRQTSTVLNSDSSKSAVVSGSGALKRRPTDLADPSSSSSPQLSSSSSIGQPIAKKIRTDSSSPTSSLVSNPLSDDDELISTVRKYLMRKPITVTELLKKIRRRKLVSKNEDAQTQLANVLRQLRPIKQMINGQHALSLKH